ncbi:cell division control protein 42 homolog [Cylas formicarius]|uniref:cell division control protein 42 homolog n=1 Tax=Cylas formicarius TaxID=197179 RepID=UPI00295866CE|nr:cell division control protein 42 homolog [Cylas formicarius]
MTPQCNPVLHYTKQPLISQNNTQVTFFNGTAKKSQEAGSRGRKKHRPRKDKIKCVIVGDRAVGKTSLAVSYSNDSFPSEYQPTAYDNYNVDVQVDGKPIRLEICDTAGKDDLEPLRQLCYPDTDVFMLCFSVVRPSTFISACTRWADELTRLDAPVVLVGCQTDLVNNMDTLNSLKRQGQLPVPPYKARDLARRLNAVYVETSAKTCNHLKEAFDQAIIVALKRRQYERQKWWTKLCCWKGRR